MGWQLHSLAARFESICVHVCDRRHIRIRLSTRRRPREVHEHANAVVREFVLRFWPQDDDATRHQCARCSELQVALSECVCVGGCGFAVVCLCVSVSVCESVCGRFRACALACVSDTQQEL